MRRNLRQQACWGLLVALFLWGGPARAEEESPFLRELTEAYVTLTRADRLREKEDLAGARETYQEALKLYQRLLHVYPGQQGDIVQYRISYCANQIEALRGQKAPAPARGAAREQDDERYQEKYFALLEENQYLHERLLEVQEEAYAETPPSNPPPAADSEALQAQLAEAEKQLAALRQEQSNTLAQAEGLRAEHDAQTAALDEKTAQLEKARDDLREETARCKKAGTELADARKEIERNSGLAAALDEAQRAAAELREQYTNALGWAEGLQAELTEQSARADKTSERLEKARRDLRKETEARKKAEEALAAAELVRQRAEAAQEEVEALKKELADRDEQLVQRSQKADELAGQWREETARSKKAEQQLVELRQQLDQETGKLSKEIAGLNQALADRATQLADRDQEFSTQARERREAVQAREKAEQELAVEREQQAAEIERLNRKLAETRQALDTAKSLAQKPPAAPETGSVEPPESPMKEGLSLERDGQFEQALARFEQVLAAQPEALGAAKARGRCLLKLGRTSEAVDILREITTRAPGDSEAPLLLGVGLCRANRYREAVEVLRVAVTAFPDHAVLRNALGAAWMGMGNSLAARRELEKAIELNPALADAHMNLAQVIARGDPAERSVAQEHYDRARELGAAADPLVEALLPNPR